MRCIRMTKTVSDYQAEDCFYLTIIMLFNCAYFNVQPRICELTNLQKPKAK
jgi:hypothetical protein